MKEKIKNIIIILCFLISIGIISTLLNVYFLSNKSKLSGFSIAEDQKKNFDISIIETNLYKNENGGLIVEGKIKNNLNKNLTYLEVVVKFYDQNNNLLNSQIDSVNFINHRETWKFLVYYTRKDYEEVKDYKVSIGEYW
jgi:hypothetical protein